MAVLTHGERTRAREMGSSIAAEQRKPAAVKSRREPRVVKPRLSARATRVGLSALVARLVTCGIDRCILAWLGLG